MVVTDDLDPVLSLSRAMAMMKIKVVGCPGLDHSHLAP
jgi:hypothetical protein